MTGYIDNNGHAVPMPSPYDDCNGVSRKAAEEYKREFIAKHIALGHKIIP